MKVADIIGALSQIAPPALQEDYDNSGLIVGAPDAPVSKALLTLDCTEAVVQEAIDLGCELIVAHHPIVFKGLKRLNGSDYVQRTVIKAIQANVAVYACHTNLDNVLYRGVNEKIASRLGLSGLKILEPRKGDLVKLVVFAPESHAAAVRDALFAAGAGKVGRYDECSFNAAGTGTFRAGEGAMPFVGTQGSRHQEAEQRIEVILPAYLTTAVLTAMRGAHPYEEIAYDLIPLLNHWQEAGAGIIGELAEPVPGEAFPALVKTALDATVVRHTRPVKMVKRVAVCGGAGSFLIRAARAAGADAFVTGDMKYHEFFDAENDLMICDPGHYESEQYTIAQFAAIISEKFPNFATIFSRTSTNPVLYHY